MNQGNLAPHCRSTLLTLLFQSFVFQPCWIHPRSKHVTQTIQYVRTRSVWHRQGASVLAAHDNQYLRAQSAWPRQDASALAARDNQNFRARSAWCRQDASVLAARVRITQYVCAQSSWHRQDASMLAAHDNQCIRARGAWRRQDASALAVRDVAKKMQRALIFAGSNLIEAENQWPWGIYGLQRTPSLPQEMVPGSLNTANRVGCTFVTIPLLQSHCTRRLRILLYERHRKKSRQFLSWLDFVCRDRTRDSVQGTLSRKWGPLQESGDLWKKGRNWKNPQNVTFYM